MSFSLDGVTSQLYGIALGAKEAVLTAGAKASDLVSGKQSRGVTLDTRLVSIKSDDSEKAEEELILFRLFEINNRPQLSQENFRDKVAYIPEKNRLEVLRNLTYLVMNSGPRSVTCEDEEAILMTLSELVKKQVKLSCLILDNIKLFSLANFFSNYPKLLQACAEVPLANRKVVAAASAQILAGIAASDAADLVADVVNFLGKVPDASLDGALKQIMEAKRLGVTPQEAREAILKQIGS